MTAAIILAAGMGSRFGGSKMLAEVNGRPMLQHVLDLCAAAALEPVVVVIGNDAASLKAGIEWHSEIRVRNPDPSRGISSSVRLGIGELRDDVDRALVLLGDQPFVTLENVRLITAAPHGPAKPIVVPRHAGQPGNPVLLERQAWPLACALDGDRGMSQLFTTHPDLVRYVEVDTISADIDTRDDLVRNQSVMPPGVSRGVEPGRSGRTEAVGRRRP